MAESGVGGQDAEPHGVDDAGGGKCLNKRLGGGALASGADQKQAAAVERATGSKQAAGQLDKLGGGPNFSRPIGPWRDGEKVVGGADEVPGAAFMLIGQPYFRPLPTATETVHSAEGGNGTRAHLSVSTVEGTTYLNRGWVD